MLLVTYSVNSGPHLVGIQIDDRVHGLTELTGATGSLLNLIRAGPRALAVISSALRVIGKGIPLSEATLHAPLRPGKLICISQNYTKHVPESARTLYSDTSLPRRPILFSKPSTAIVGPEEPVLHNGDLTEQLDWECELAVVIGRTAKKVTAEDAYDHIFGYSIVNDISARDQRRSGYCFYSKGQDSYAPFGPGIRTADDIRDPHRLDLSLRVNGAVKQKSNTRYMLFRIPELIEDITAGMTLEPGDVISTGSPAGVGASFTPQQFLRPGDVVEATVESIGTLRNPVVDAR